MILQNLIFIVIGFAGVAIATLIPPRGPRSKTLFIILCCILAGGGTVGVISTSSGKIKELEATSRDFNDLMKGIAQQEELKRNCKIRYGTFCPAPR